MHCLEIACWTITIKCCFKLELSLSLCTPSPVVIFLVLLLHLIFYAELFCLLGHFASMSYDGEASLSNLLLNHSSSEPCHHIIQFETLASMFKGTTHTPTHMHTHYYKHMQPINNVIYIKLQPNKSIYLVQTYTVQQ